MRVKFLAYAPGKVAKGNAVSSLIGNKLTCVDEIDNSVDVAELSDKELEKTKEIINEYKNLMSFSNTNLMSGILYLSMAIRSIPKPKA